jgi:hypothetical protein
MDIEITSHAKERMRAYNVSKERVIETIENPTNILPGYGNRTIYQKALNSHILRVVVEEGKEIKGRIVITVYKARSGRYEIQI